ncbi:hypothetical protein LTR36_001366 [Oleoguttula mirabilis]|uniref:Shelterin complex subunit TPP1/Est3 domain-containing protein n=1 Tax=Oleoguttula mirabilis TaxID=1507867 RepID=A0AAV9JP20_9PEZI|nr:hypothetical protein LTR36_001366 [Oleoguttula mirabilis]
MAKALPQWLGSFVEAELAAVVKWNNDIKETPKIKNDPDSRFSDDGSNFRSAVGAPHLSTSSKAQLIKVFTGSNPASVLLSDGQVSIRATLSEDAVAVLEDELEEKLSPDMKGDILSLAAVTLVSTPYGPADGHVQLYIDDWQYQYHLRKSVGDPKPIEKQQQVGHLLETIKHIRTQQYHDEDVGEHAQAGPLQQGPDAVLEVSRLDISDLPQPRRLKTRVHSPRSSGQDTIIKGTQFSTIGEEMEMAVPRPLQDPALVHRQQRSEHFKKMQRRDWLQANYIVSYDSTPYISTVHKAYLAAHASDAATLADFKQTVGELYPSLKGFPPRSLARRKDAMAAAASFSRPSSVRPVSRHLDGSNDADDAPRPGAVGEEIDTSALSNGLMKPSAAPPNQKRSFEIYEDTPLRGNSAGLKDDGKQRASLNQDQANGCRDPMPVASRTQAPEQVSKQQPPRVRQRVLVANGVAHYQDGVDDNNTREDIVGQSRIEPTTVFGELLTAWKHLRPGGAFAKPVSHAPRAKRRMDVLSWDV